MEKDRDHVGKIIEVLMQAKRHALFSLLTFSLCYPCHACIVLVYGLTRTKTKQVPI